jgi:ABC-2 type transport system permease protein
MAIIIFTIFIIALIPSVNSADIISDIEQTMPVNNNMSVRMLEFINEPGALNVPLVIGAFIFYFIFGYLFYTTLFASIGSISDDESSNQLFTMPISLPIIFSLYIVLNVADNPHSSLAIWASMIPFCSPIVMLARIPFSVPLWQILFSAFILIISFLFATWVSGKIYRIGILLYGKKVTWKDLWKFVRL